MEHGFRLATFNLENLDWSPPREKDFARRMRVLRPILEKLGADILCLQEVHAQKATAHAPRLFHALDRLLADTPYEAFHRVTSLRPGKDTPADIHNLAVLSRWPILERRQLHHDLVPAWRWTPPIENGVQPEPIDITWDRPLLYACVALPRGSPLHVMNLHLRAPRAAPIASARGVGSSRSIVEGQFVAAQKREGQALEARLFVESLFDREPRARLAVCGDFNADEHDAPTRLLRAARDETAPQSERMLIPIEERVCEKRRYSVIHAGRPTLIDHILASPALAAAWVETAILNEGLQDEVFTPDPIDGSLHAPVVANFRF